MARAGDGGARSERRRLTGQISLRTTDDEKRRFMEAARKHLFPSLAAWALDRLRAGDGLGPRDRRILSGMLGGLGAKVSALATGAGAMPPAELQDSLRDVASEIAAMQRRIIEGERRVG